MFVIRLMRLGSRKKPFYRIIAIDVRNPRNGRLNEILGYYNPLNFKNEFFISNFSRFLFLIQNGTKISSTIFFLLKKFYYPFFFYNKSFNFLQGFKQ